MQLTKTLSGSFINESMTFFESHALTGNPYQFGKLKYKQKSNQEKVILIKVVQKLGF